MTYTPNIKYPDDLETFAEKATFFLLQYSSPKVNIFYIIYISEQWGFIFVNLGQSSENYEQFSVLYCLIYSNKI